MGQLVSRFRCPLPFNAATAAVCACSGILSARQDLGVVWVDAHADINDPITSPSGNIHGMPVSFLAKMVE